MLETAFPEPQKFEKTESPEPQKFKETMKAQENQAFALEKMFPEPQKLKTTGKTQENWENLGKPRKLEKAEPQHSKQQSRSHRNLRKR